MKNRIKNFLLRRLSPVKNPVLPNSYSQDSEDDIIEKIFWGKENGFFVDIGAFHPTNYSNTYKFYLKGWSGINIDPRKNMRSEFNLVRPRDINLEIAVADKKGELDYYEFDPPGVSTFNKEIAFGRNISNGFNLVETRKVKTDSLVNILDRFSEGRKIDFLNIDVEGFEAEILKKNNWDKYKPNVIICEMLFSKVSDNPAPFRSVEGSEFWAFAENLNCFEAHNLLIEKGYGVLAKGVGSVIYVNKKGKWE